MKKHIYNNPVGVKNHTGLILIMPFIIGFVLFTLYPFVSSFITGMTDYDGINSPEFTGFENYRNMFSDSDFIKSVTVTFKYALILVPLKLIFSLLAAMLLSAEIKGIGIFRTAFYIPSILGSNLAIVIMWQFLFTSKGLVNQFLEIIGLSPISWYSQPAPAMFMIVLLRLWEFGSSMIIFLNALRDIPQEYYDAAKTDGCGNVKAFFYITVPMLRNVIFLNLVLQTISAFQEFNAPYMITGGNPAKSTFTIGMLIYNAMFKYSEIGYANAVSWVLFVIIAVITALMFRITKK